MKKITKLSKEQEEQLAVYRDRHIRLAKNINEADWADAEIAVKEMLTIAGLSPDVRVIRCRNPTLASQAGDLLAKRIEGVGGKTLFQSCSYGSVVARASFFAEVCGLEFDENVERARLALAKFVASCGGAYFHEQFVIIYDRPSILSISTNDERTGVLHSENGPAIAWGRGDDGKYDPADPYGYSLYYWEGTEVPSHWIEEKPRTPEEMTSRAQEVLSSDNLETMRAGCEILGWLPVLESLGMRVLDENPNPMFGKLVAVDLPEAPDSRFLIAECGTGRTIAVPTSQEATTALEAGAMSYGVPTALYKKLKVRT